MDAGLEDVRALRAEVVTAHVQRYVGGGLVTSQTQQQVPVSITIPLICSKSTYTVRLVLPRTNNINKPSLRKTVITKFNF